ncbi:MAG TPA: hypothetical protein VI215_06930 [Bacteroidota bacterium]|jgi:hypothetical protein
MARKLYYTVADDGQNRVSEPEWEDILRLQHWYNSEFIWTAGRLAFKMFAVFPNIDARFHNEEELWQRILRRKRELRQAGASENQIILQLEMEGLVIAKKGGYFDHCLASGFTRVAANEFNAYLVCEFLLKASGIAREISITLQDEGEFVKPKKVIFRNGRVLLPLQDSSRRSLYEMMVGNRHVFAIVDAAKYDRFPFYQTTIADFNDLPADEQHGILKDWNWLGFENNYDINGDDIQGFDLNKKVASFEILHPDSGELFHL